MRSAVIHTMSLAAATLTATRGWAARHGRSRAKLRADMERLEQEVALLKEEIRLKDARMSRVTGHERPHYAPIERLALLELRALRGWSVDQTAERFQLSRVTVSNWMRRLDEKGPDALVQSPRPMNKYPDYVVHIVQRLKVLCPTFGYGRIVHVLGREGLRLGTSTVSRMTRRAAVQGPEPTPDRVLRPMKKVIARKPHDVWHCDLTTIPTSSGIWTSKAPFSLPPRWPFSWWVVVLADQFSARILGLAIFPTRPTTKNVRDLVRRAMEDAGVAPKFLITDKGEQFRNRTFRPWCRRIGIRHHYGALGQFGSIPFVERLIRTIKVECAQRILVPLSGRAARRELALFTAWYNGVRPHERLRGATPDEVHDGILCVPPFARGRLAVHVSYLKGRRHLPIVSLAA